MSGTAYLFEVWFTDVMAKRKLLGFVNLWLFIAACSYLQLADAAQISCNFDEGLCSGWRQSSSDVFDWTRFSGSTTSFDTGPISDNGGSGYYMYIETSGRRPGDNAKLELLVSKNKTFSCLTFYYHMFGSSMGTLYVFNGNAIVFTKSGNQGDIWKKVTRTLDVGGALTFEGIRGSSFTSDIAIDDVSVSEGRCPGCGGHLNESTGQLHVSGAENSDLHCNWTIGSTGISQAIALVSIQGLYLQYCREFVKIYDSKGSEIFTQTGCSSFVRQTLLEIPLTNASSVIVEVSLEYRLSYVNIQYDILKHGLDSAQLVPSWNITVTNVSSNSVWLEWSPFPLNLPISKYLVKYKQETSNVTLLLQVSNSTISHQSSIVLKPYTSYKIQVLVIAKDMGNVPYLSKPVSVRTDEGVPSRSPQNVSVTRLQFNEVVAQWDRLPQQYTHGRLLGYRVYYKESRFPYYNQSQMNITADPQALQVILRDLKAAQTYEISVAAFTSKGEGPRSYRRFITTGCGGYLNKSTGQLHVSDAYNSDLHCSWTIGSPGISQAVALVSIQGLYLPYCREFVKIYDNKGAEIFTQPGCSSFVRQTLLEIPLTNASSIIVEVYLEYRLSFVNIQYDILKHGIDSAQLVPSWNITVTNVSSNSVWLEWSPFPLNLPISKYLVKYKQETSNVTLLFQVSNSTISHQSSIVLKPYTSYKIQVLVIAKDMGNVPYSSKPVSVRTDEGVPSRSPQNVSVTRLQFNEVMVQWDRLPQQYTHGRLLGYRVYYKESRFPYYNQSQMNITADPQALQVILRDLKAAQTYEISVAAFTSKGGGPRSFRSFITTGCGGHLNKSTGQLHVSGAENSDLHCSWTIESAGISQAVALVSIQGLNLQYCSEFVKIIDGNGADVFYQQGCSSFGSDTLRYVLFGKANNITVQIFFESRLSFVKLQYVILKQRLLPALPVTGWNLTVTNAAPTSLTVEWEKLIAEVDRSVRSYIAFVKSRVGIVLAVEIVPENTTVAVLRGLNPLTQYKVGVVAVDGNGQPYQGAEATSSTTKASCGIRPSSTRIVGGMIAPVNSWPWQAMLITRSGRQFCGGSLLDPLWVVTAAHCVDGQSASSIRIRLGAHFRAFVTLETEQDIDVARIVQHRNFNYPLLYSNDIAIIKLAKPATLGKGVDRVCLPNTNYALPFDNANKKCWITGWGTLSSGGLAATSLRQASLPLVSEQRCLTAYTGKLDDSMFCAGLDEGGVDACQGDSGGPLVCESNGTWYLEGATSWGEGCADANKYGVYASIRHFKDWILSNMLDVAPLPTPTFSPAIPSSSISAIVWCNFESALCPGLSQSSSDDFDWTIGSGTTLSPLTGPSSGHGGSGNYVYIETSFPRLPGENARLEISVPRNGAASCLTFYYHMLGASMGTLNVFSGPVKVFSISGNQSNSWIQVQKAIDLDGVVIFEGITGSSYTGDLAIDDVLITTGSCPVSCNFEEGLCSGWSQSSSDVFDWTLVSGPTSSSNTGPSSGHGGSGYYMYIETSSPRVRGDNAKLELLVPGNKTSSCLTFYYHMFGSSMGTLYVFNGNAIVFTKSGNQGDIWKKVTRTLDFGGAITFEGVTGSSFTSDIAIDDVSVSEGSCPGCGGHLNESAGQLHVSGAENSDLHCNWTIGSAGISQAVALLSIQGLNLQFCREFVNIFDNKGANIFFQPGCSSFVRQTLLEIPLTNTSRVIVEVALEYRLSFVNIQYDILKHGSDSAQLVPSWNITVTNVSSNSVWLEWSPFPLNLPIRKYLVKYKQETSNDTLLLQVSNSTISHKSRIVLKPYTSYKIQVLVIAKDLETVPYSSKSVSVRTDEGVPSRSPQNVSVTRLQFNEVMVQWDRLPQQYTHGRLLGYRVYYKESRFPYYDQTQMNSTTDPQAVQVILRDLKAAQRYEISVAAFTSKGEGPRSFRSFITTGCGGHLNKSTGQLHVSGAENSNLHCNWTIGSAGISQAVALVSVQGLFLVYCREFFKIYDSKGSEIFAQQGCSSFIRDTLLEIPLMKASSVTVEISFEHTGSSVGIEYDILKDGIDSAQIVPSWNITVISFSYNYVSLKWSPFPLNLPISKYLVKYKQENSNVTLLSDSRIISPQATIVPLKPSTSYQFQVLVIAKDMGDVLYSSKPVSIRTDEGVPSRSPQNVRVARLQFHEVMVQWDHLPQQYTHGRLLGYRVYYKETRFPYSQMNSTADPQARQVILRDLKAAQTYEISVAAFTSKGEGPKSYRTYITTGTKPPIPTQTSTTTKPSERVRTPSEEEVRESVTLIVVLDVSMWSKAMEDAFKTTIAELATKYCASVQRRCHSTPTSFRKRRSSDNIAFSESEVHILPGYPTQTPQDPLQAWLAFYLQFPAGESSDVVNRYHLMNIVNSDMSAIEKSLNSPISKVQTLSDDDEEEEEQEQEQEEQEQEEQEEEKSKVNYVVILGSVGGGVFVVCLIAAVLKTKCKRKAGGIAKPRIDAETAAPTSGSAYKNEALEQESSAKQGAKPEENIKNVKSGWDVAM